MNKLTDSKGLLARYNANLEHAYSVRDLSLLIFDKINFVFDIGGKPERLLLENAALLHDIGYFIEEEDHNVHSYNMILKDGLIDFSKNEISVIANIVKYHRGRKPDKEHPPYSNLDKVSRKMVKKLCSILRIADGLDGNFEIKDINIEHDVDNNVLYFVLNVDGDYNIEDLGSAIRKKDLFERTFKRQVVFKLKTLI